MTEDEAKAKWCPMAHPEMGTLTGVNRAWDGAPNMAAKCLGSRCMMWRWTNEVTGRGYCGLAGVPRA